jgi:hypothetical protein
LNASSFKKNPLRGLIFHIKEPWVKLKKNIVVKSKMMNGNKAFGGMWNMKNFVEMQVLRGSINDCMTNMTNAHTLPICRMDLITALVLLLHGELVELTGDVVGGAGVAIPIGVHAVGVGHDIGTLFSSSSSSSSE